MKLPKRLYNVYVKSLQNSPRLSLILKILLPPSMARARDGDVLDLLRVQILPSSMQSLIDAESFLVQMNAHPLLGLQWLVLQ